MVLVLKVGKHSFLIITTFLCSTDPNLCKACVLVYCKMSYSEYANHTQTQLINTLFNVIQASLGNVVAQRGLNLSVKR